MRLYTSIPATVSRKVNGQDVGKIWTRMCLDSWHGVGYEVVSVNAEVEGDRIRALYPDVNVVDVGRDGAAMAGRPLVYLSDILSIAVRDGRGWFALANADVLILRDAAERLRDWVPEAGFVYSNRLDIDDLQGNHPKLHGGVDFLILNSIDLQAMHFPDFLFGTPWWDYWLPIILNCKGVKGRRIAHNNLPVIAHLFHQDQWSHEQFLQNFSLFMGEVIKSASARDDLSTAARSVDALTGLPGPILRTCLEYAQASSKMIHQENPLCELGA